MIFDEYHGMEVCPKRRKGALVKPVVYANEQELNPM